MLYQRQNQTAVRLILGVLSPAEALYGNSPDTYGGRAGACIKSRSSGTDPPQQAAAEAAPEADAISRCAKNARPLDFNFNEKMNRGLVFDLATASFVTRPEDALFLGPPGTGKNPLAQAIGQAKSVGL